MCSAYVLSPVQNEVYNLIHKISHQLVSEKQYMEAEDIHGEYHHHDFLASRTIQEKDHHHEKKETDAHTHGLLSLLSAYFTSDENRDKKQKLTIEVKPDKHTLPENTKEEVSLLMVVASNVFFHADKNYKIGLEVKTPPPKVDLT